MLLAGLSRMRVLGQGGTLQLRAPMRWRLPLLVGSLTGGLLLIFRSLLSSTLVGGLLRFLVLVPVSLSGLIVGQILLIGPLVLYLGLYRMLAMFIGGACCGSS